MSNPPKKGGALAIGAYVPAVARAAFESHGFPTASILSDWPQIIGEEFAAFTVPERLVWPRMSDLDNAPGAGSRDNHRRREGATLHIRVDGPRSLEVQHMAQQLLERVNVYFGYRAVAELRIVQGPVSKKAEPGDRIIPAEDVHPEIVEGIEDRDLREALRKLRARATD